MANRSKGTDVPSEHPRFNTNTCQEHCSHYHSNQKSFAPIHLTRNRLRRASVTFEVSISCSVLHTRSIRYSHKSQNDWKDSVRLLRPVLVVFDKKELLQLTKWETSNSSILTQQWWMRVQRESGYWHTARLPSKSGQNEQRSFQKVLVCDTQIEMTRPVPR